MIHKVRRRKRYTTNGEEIQVPSLLKGLYPEDVKNPRLDQKETSNPRWGTDRRHGPSPEKGDKDS